MTLYDSIAGAMSDIDITRTTLVCNPADEDRINNSISSDKIRKMFRVVTSDKVNPGKFYLCQPGLFPLALMS